ncbi:hypothetical protein [Fluviispira multicolorata]|uniref:Uncharacterized protein n=1 Tax=Fluviispira multicolorata TaxID=2654512 RepID=A0A833JFJ4_9BACT|nr:hypothetical protein [Fluviispira multicolorata]KAB8030989.1 hypothetical protein GCL57_08455 [Fluviispira multicolorata]
MQNSDNSAFRRKGDLGVPLVIGLFVLAIILGWVVFRNYEYSSKEITTSLAQMQKESPSLSLNECAEKTINWFKKCDAMTQLCDDTVSRMIKVCIANSDKSKECTQYGNDIYTYNFGVKQCAPYMHDKKLKREKKACADTWQTVADFCKTVAKRTAQNH